MQKYMTSLPQIIEMMNFVSDVSTLYQVEPGPEFRLVASNSKAQVRGSAPPSLYGQRLSDFLPKEFYLNTLLPIITQVVETKQFFRGEHCAPYPGRSQFMDCLITPIVENDVCTHVWVVTRPQGLDEDLEYLSSTDELTGVSNRRFFMERLNKALKRYLDQSIEFSIMVIDLDSFKIINDSNGHQFGDRLLRDVVKRISSCVREGDLIGRLGGDEFVILTEGENSSALQVCISKRILAKMHEPFHISGADLSVKLSIGIAHSRGQQDVESILSDADTAMYNAKSLGGNTYVEKDF